MARIAALLLLALLALAAPAAPAGAATYPAGFEERPLVTGLSQPTAVDWTPDGRTLVIEKAGVLKVAEPGAKTARTVLDLSADVNSRHDRGLLGLAVDSAFATNGYVYLLYTYELNRLAPDGEGPMVSQLRRLTLRADSTVAAQKVLLGTYTAGVCPAPRNDLDCIPSEGLSHSIGTVRSAPDGTLYVGSGDAASYSYVDPVALRTYDERTPAGKVLRIDREGRGLPGHPFCPAVTDLSAVCTKVWAKGFRNPFRFELRPDGAGLAIGDVGWGSREEVGLVRTGGRSHGWPCYEGDVRTGGYRDLAQCATEYAKEGGPEAHVGPSHAYLHGSGAAVMGGPTYLGAEYPAGYRGTVFFSDYSQGFIKRLEVDGNDKVTAVRDFATGWSGVDLTTAPSGDVTFVSFGTGAPGTGSVVALAYAPGNRAPVAAATATPPAGAAPLAVTLDAGASRDPDGDALTFRWDLGDGTTATGARVTRTYATPGTYTAKVTVSDGRGRSAEATVRIDAGNAAPVPRILTPAAGTKVAGGETVTLTGAADDEQDGKVPASGLSWRVTLHHGEHTHPLGDWAGTGTATFTVRTDHDADTWYEVTLTAKDAAGLTGTATRRLDPRTASVTLASDPPGAPLSYAGVDVTAPSTRTSAVGFATSVTAAERFDRAGVPQAFQRWSDGSTSRVRDLTVPAAGTTLTAVYAPVAPTRPVPVAAYAFDEGAGTVARDASGRGNDGAIRGARWTAGRYGGGLSFDGVDDWVTVADSASLKPTTALTLEAWIRPRSRRAWQSVLVKEQPGWLSWGLYATSGAWNGTGSIEPSGWVSGRYVRGPAALPSDAWSHLAMTFDGAAQRLYVDGVLVSTLASTAPAPTVAGALRIGGNANWSEFFDGVVDEVRVYDRALTGADVAADRDTAIAGGQPAPGPAPVLSLAFDEGAGTVARDGSGRGNDGTVRGATWTTGRTGGALAFDGVDDWVTVADHASLRPAAELTLGAWVRPRTRRAWQSVLVKEQPGWLSWGLYATSGAWDGVGTVEPSGWVGGRYVRGPSVLPTGTWSHLAMTFDGAQQRLYVDGTLVATLPSTTPPSTAAGALRIGGNANWNEFFDGALDDVRVFDTALTGTQVRAEVDRALATTTRLLRTRSSTAAGGVLRYGQKPRRSARRGAAVRRRAVRVVRRGGQVRRGERVHPPRLKRLR